MRRRSRPHAFTLIEMLVVLAVFGLLAAIAIPRYRAARERAYVATMAADLRDIRLAEEMYFAEWGEYSLSAETLGFRPSSQVAVSLSSSDKREAWHARATHALADRECEEGEGPDAPAGPTGVPVCSDRADDDTVADH